MSAAFALAAALSWTLASLFGHGPSRELGSLHFNRLRMVVASFLLVLMIVLTGGSFQIDPAYLLSISASAIIGVAIGDYFLFVAMRRLGPRRTGILFASNAPIAALLGWLFLSEALSLWSMIAIFIGFVGVVLAIIYGKRQDLLHIWEDITPPLWIGIAAGLLAAVGQASGVLLLRPVMEAGADPLMAALVRCVVAGLCFWFIMPFEKTPSKAVTSLSRRLLWLILLNGFFGVSFGVALLLKALETGNVAEVTMLSAVGPVMILPFIWYQTGKVPAVGAWGGAVLVVLCTWLLILTKPVI